MDFVTNQLVISSDNIRLNILQGMAQMRPCVDIRNRRRRVKLDHMPILYLEDPTQDLLPISLLTAEDNLVAHFSAHSSVAAFDSANFIPGVSNDS